ncbi:cytochrome P450 [Sphingomonas immobilis]|uniref:Cytochrome P450 n=1 Tax=Sphingomonas immobilis TaxID=3063997 RepID=A0ABT9A1R9_9SPHN|nr:cytochrome P450 [Sphingomonas sp. CA1-15]MDO7843780.1 cytochrome P450 [Sphingomonas sp. CA1-15]
MASVEMLDVPAHVPPERVWNHEPAAFAAQFDDPFVGIAQLHDGPDIVYAKHPQIKPGVWLPTRFAVINDIFLDAARFSSVNNIAIGPLLGVDWRLNPVDFDPPEHMRYRQILQPFFQPSAINRYDEHLRDVSRELIDRFEQRGSCEFVSEFSNLFPTYFFLDLLGMPREMLPQFLEWSEAYVRGETIEAKVVGARSILKYIEGYVEDRRNDQRDDLVSGILNAEINGRPLDHGEVIGMIMLVYFGGLETVVSSLGWYFQHLATHPELQARLRDNPADIPGAVNDYIRAYGVVGTRRLVTEDVRFHGVELKKGDMIMVPGFLASRDDRQFADPHVIDPDRKARHLSFATGVHNCLGAHLARREITIAFEEFLSRFANIRVAESGAFDWTTAGVWAVTRLDLTWG